MTVKVLAPRLSLLAAVALGGCSFDTSGLYFPTTSGDLPQADAAPSDAAPPDAAPDAAPPRFCDASDPDLVACYPFESGSIAGEPRDESSYGNHGTATGASLTQGRGGRGQALVTSAASDVRVPDSASLDVTTALTLEVWIQPRALPASGRAAVLDNNGQYGLFLAPTGEVRCAMSANLAAGLEVTAGRWTHLACTFDGEVVRLYQDGALRVSVESDAPLAVAPTDGLTLGQNSPSGDPLDGAIDELRIWSVARSADQICAAAGC